MKDIRPALRTLLLSDPTVSGLVGGMRIYSTILPQGQREASIVFSRVSGVFPFELDASAGIVQNLIQIDSVSPNVENVNTLANAVHDVLSGFKGEVSAVAIQGVFQTNERDIYESGVQLFRVSRDYSIWFVEN